MEHKTTSKTSSVFIILIVVLSVMLGVCIGIQIEEKKISKSKTEYFNMENETININTCTIEQLMNLSGIGDVKARKIINYRPYRYKSELLDVLGTKTYNNIKQKVRCK